MIRNLSFQRGPSTIRNADRVKMISQCICVIRFLNDFRVIRENEKRCNLKLMRRNLKRVYCTISILARSVFYKQHFNFTNKSYLKGMLH